MTNINGFIDEDGVKKPTSRNGFQRLLDYYNKYLESHPVITKISTAFIVGALGDILVQSYGLFSDSEIQAVYLRRILVFATVSGFFIAPLIHVWYNFLNKLQLPHFLNTNLGRALTMVLLDQTIAATVVTTVFFFGFELVQTLFPPYPVTTFEDGGLVGLFITAYIAGQKSFQHNMWPTMIASWYVWPFIMFINFLFVPLQYRVLFSNFASIFWNMYLSNVANAKPAL